MSATNETIVATVTPPGRGGVSIIRLSGPETRRILAKLVTNAEAILVRPRKLVLTDILDVSVEPHAVLDTGLAVLFDGTASYTGEPSAEIHLHGSPFLVRRCLASAMHLGARIAEPGEFTKRAYLNGKLDLAQAEAVSDLISAETEAQARVAQAQLAGKLSQALAKIGEPLRDQLALIEAFIDFPEEEIGVENLASWCEMLKQIRMQLEELQATFRYGKLERDGAEIALIGAPNVGKSSLMNALLGESRAIVTAIPGTTRDEISEQMTIGGHLVRIWDTAGVRADAEVLDPIEQIGIERSLRRLEQADLVLHVVDLSIDQGSAATEPEMLLEKHDRTLRVGNKADVKHPTTFEGVVVSALTGEGIADLRVAISKALFSEAAEHRGSVMITTERHARALAEAALHVSEALAILSGKTPQLEIAALVVRSALRELDEIVGVTTTEDLLGRIFSKFCIGK